MFLAAKSNQIQDLRLICVNSQLTRVAGMMQQNPGLMPELGSLTDSRGLDSLNYDHQFQNGTLVE
ncbi:MAG: hypothetical protein IPF93_25485 [Saprospiraceae bacterium]|nr:hypothetical protein [Saprospiraceae bacterium]